MQCLKQLFCMVHESSYPARLNWTTNIILHSFPCLNYLLSTICTYYRSANESAQINDSESHSSVSQHPGNITMLHSKYLGQSAQQLQKARKISFRTNGPINLKQSHNVEASHYALTVQSMTTTVSQLTGLMLYSHAVWSSPESSSGIVTSVWPCNQNM